MAHVNIEIKARCSNPDAIRAFLQENKADFKGSDHQLDTYFRVPNGRLKLRLGNIENSLIFYDRPNQPGPKQADVSLFQTDTVGGVQLAEALTSALEILVVVDKQREIYFIENVKFHIDDVKDLGTFVEIEAIDEKGDIGTEKLQSQCRYYINAFDIQDLDLVHNSYSDLLMDD